MLAHRAAHGYQPSRATMERLAHHPRRFPCTNRPARLHLPALHGHEHSRGHDEGDAFLVSQQRRDGAHRLHHSVSHQDPPAHRRLLAPWLWPG